MLQPLPRRLQHAAGTSRPLRRFTAVFIAQQTADVFVRRITQCRATPQNAHAQRHIAFNRHIVEIGHPPLHYLRQRVLMKQQRAVCHAVRLLQHALGIDAPDNMQAACTHAHHQPVIARQLLPHFRILPDNMIDNIQK